MRRKPKYLDRGRRIQWEVLTQQYLEARQRVCDLLKQSATVQLISPLHDPLMKTLD